MLDNLNQFIGQRGLIKQILAIMVDPARKYWNILLRGTYGYGKTTLALLLTGIISCYTIQVPVRGKVEVAGDYIHIIDECHNIKPPEELYPLMKTYKFMLCTNSASKLPEPFLSRCYSFTLQDYTSEELGEIVGVHAGAEGVTLIPEVCRFIADRSRGNPRTGVISLQKYLSYCRSRGWGFNLASVAQTFKEWGIDRFGLDHLDRLYLAAIRRGPRSKRTLQMLLNIDECAFDRRERFLIQSGLVNITSRGRVL